MPDHVLNFPEFRISSSVCGVLPVLTFRSKVAAHQNSHAYLGNTCVESFCGPTWRTKQCRGAEAPSCSSIETVNLIHKSDFSNQNQEIKLSVSTGLVNMRLEEGGFLSSSIYL